VQVRQQADAHKAQRLAIIAELKAWTEAHAANTDWKAQVRALHTFSERWREAGHMSEKAFAEMQPQWKTPCTRPTPAWKRLRPRAPRAARP
jgi:hypothetical protein